MVSASLDHGIVDQEQINLVRKAIEVAGSNIRLAGLIGVTPRVINVWLKGKVKARIYSVEAMQRIISK